MMKMLALAIMPLLVFAQVQHQGTFAPLGSLKSLHHAVLRLPPLSNDELMVAAAMADSMNPGPSRFGEAVEVKADMSQGEWTVREGRREWTLEISSPGAVTLSLLFDQFFIPNDGEFYVIGQNVLLLQLHLILIVVDHKGRLHVRQQQ